MQKIKTHRASAKRFSLTKSGKVKMNHSQHRHKLGIKTAKRKRTLRARAYMSEAMAPAYKPAAAAGSAALWGPPRPPGSPARPCRRGADDRR